MRRCTIALTALCALFAATGCGGENDTEVGGRINPANQVFNAPDHFSSVVSFCDGKGHRVYENDHGDSPDGGGALAVIEDASCPGGVTPPGR